MQHSKSYQDGSASLFGAKITGGGSGGSVCVIGRNCIQSTEEIQKVKIDWALSIFNFTGKLIVHTSLWRRLAKDQEMEFA